MALSARCALFLAAILFALCAPAHAANQQQVADFVRDTYLGGSYGSVNMWMTANPLDTGYSARHPQWGLTSDISFPYLLTWIVMIDDNPGANWGHPVRWIFVSDDLLAHQLVFDTDWFPVVIDSVGSPVSFGCVEVTTAPCVSDPPSGSSGTPPTGLDEDCLYAVLVSGGWNDNNDHARYTENLRDMYQMLRDCGYPKANISVYYADGTKLRDLDNADGDNDDATGNDVDGAATETNVSGKIGNLCTSLDPYCDVLFIYGTNHGASKTCNAGTNKGDVCKQASDCPGGSCTGRNGLVLWNTDSDGSIDDSEIYEPGEFAADTADCQVDRLFAVFDQCYSGQFTGVAGDGNHGNSAIYAAATDSEPSWGREYMDQWTQNNLEDPINDIHQDIEDNGNLSSTPQEAEGTAGNGDESICHCPCEGQIPALGGPAQLALGLVLVGTGLVVVRRRRSLRTTVVTGTAIILALITMAGMSGTLRNRAWRGIAVLDCSQVCESRCAEA